MSADLPPVSPPPSVTPPVPSGQPVPIPPGAGSVTATKRTSAARSIAGALIVIVALVLPYVTSTNAGAISLLQLPWYVTALIGAIGLWLIGGADPPPFLRDSLTYIFTRGIPIRFTTKPDDKPPGGPP